MVKTIGKCIVCGDAIYDFQKIRHEGCIEDGIVCPRCGEVFHDKDIETNTDAYYTCPECFTIQHERCRNLPARIWNEDGTSGVATGANKPVNGKTRN